MTQILKALKLLHLPIYPRHLRNDQKASQKAKNSENLNMLAMLGGILACFSSPGLRFARHLVEMKPTDALHLPI